MMKTINYFLSLGVLLCCTSLCAQDSFQKLRERNHETLDDPYIAIDRASMKRSPAYTMRRSNVFTTQVNIDVAGQNIVGDAANEPSLAIDPTNPNRMVMGWRQFDTVASNFRQAGNGYSTDGGTTWVFQEVLEFGNFRSDPVLRFDKDGNFFYNSLAGSGACDLFAIRDGSTTWEPSIPARGGDKQWMAIDRSNSIGSGNNYALWDTEFSSCPGGFTRSTDNSLTFDECTAIPQEPFFGTLAVNRNGVVYAVGASFMTNGLILLRSNNAKDQNSAITWEPHTDLDMDGVITLDLPINPVGLLGQLWVDVDVSSGPGRNNVYVLSTIDRASNEDPADVMFIRSTDGGQTFEAPIRINTDDSETNFNWFGTMAVAPNGRIDVIWYDTRDAPDGTFISELYYSFSDDQGDTWSDNESISAGFDPNLGYPNQQKIGDYIDMISDNLSAHIAWTATFNGEQDVYYTNVTPTSTISVEGFETTALKGTVYPNPFENTIILSLDQQLPANTHITVYDFQGKKIKSLTASANSKSIIWDGSSTLKTTVASGLYFLEVRTESQSQVFKVLKK